MRRILSLLLVMVMTATVMLWVVPPIEVSAATTLTENEFIEKIEKLQARYPHKQYWNERNGTEKIDGITTAKAGTLPCEGTREEGKYINQKCTVVGFCDVCSCKCGEFHGWQCFGFANLMAYHTFGSYAVSPAHVANTSKGWNKLTSVSTFYAGDVVRIDKDTHSIFIHKVTDTDVYYVDCNSGVPCQIEWNNKISISNLISRITYVVRMSGNTLKGTHQCTKFEGLGVCTECNKTFNWEKTFDKTAAGTYTVAKQFTPRTDAPYNDATKASTTIKKGTAVEVVGAYTNAYENKWYKFTYNNGKSVGYVHAPTSDPYLSFSKPNALSVQCTGFKPSSNASLPQGQTYTASGTISSNYPLKTVEAYLDGSKYTTWTASDQKTTSLSIASTVISSKLNFANMSLGAHTIKLKATDIHNQTSTFFTVSFNIANNPANNVLRINYNANGGTVTGPNYYLSSSMVYLKSSSKPVAGVYQYGVTYTNGLHNDTTFGLVREGYEFVGWSLTADGSGVIFDQDMPFKPEDLVSELINGDKTVTMYAIWEKVGCDHNYHIKDDSYDTNFKAFPYAKITNDNLFDADHNKMNANNWIAATDECTILEVYTDGCCKVTYPLDSGGTRTLYSKISLFNIVYECDHSYTYKSNSTGHWKECTLCGDKQTTSSHTYTNNCDKSCNTCGYTRSISHTYSNSCDTSCNVCGETRTITHTYGSTYSYNSVDHWKTCTVCGHYEYITEHTYSNSCDKWCDVCAAERTITHTYSNSCDTSCNVCGETRTTTHSYGSSYGYDSVKHWKSCTICGSASTSSYHYFADSCDTSCNICGYERTTTHTYDNDCDTSCNVCGETRSTQHVYDNEEDTTCNICNDVRTVETLPTTTPEPETNPNTKPNVEPNTKPNTNDNNQSNSKDEDDDDDINQTTIIIIAGAVTISAVSIFGTALVIKKKR